MKWLLILSAFVGVWAVGHSEPAKKDAKKERAPETLPAYLKDHWFLELNYEGKQSIDKQRMALYGLEWWFYWVGKDDPPNRSYLTDHDNESAQTVGEIFVNTKANPMWLDFKYKDGLKEYVWLGIVKFDGDNLHWVRSWANHDPAKYAAAKGDLEGRPKSFTSADGKPLGYRLEPIIIKKK